MCEISKINEERILLQNSITNLVARFIAKNKDVNVYEVSIDINHIRLDGDAKPIGTVIETKVKIEL